MQSQAPHRNRKKLNVPLIKGLVMMGIGLFFAFLSALTGISPQLVAVAVIIFLLGFQPARAQGTALAYTLSTGIGAVAGAAAGGVKPDYTVGLIVAVGATLGAILVAKVATGPRARLLMRVGQSVAIILAIYVVGEALRHRVGGPRTLSPELLVQNRAVGAFVVGIVVGAIAHILQVTTGVFLVPALIYLAGLRIADAVTTSLMVLALASLLPTLGYAAKQAVDRGPGYWMCVGGLLGGLAGGALLGRLGVDNQLSLALFGLGAMILSGWTLSKMT